MSDFKPRALPPLVEVKQAMKEAMDVFNRIKTEKMQADPPPPPGADASLHGVPKEIVDKAHKQKERERANRASAAASRNKVMRYQTELEGRLNRVEAERNALRAQLASLSAPPPSAPGDAARLETARRYLAALRAAHPAAVDAVVGLASVDALVGGCEHDELVVAAAAAAAAAVAGSAATLAMPPDSGRQGEVMETAAAAAAAEGGMGFAPPAGIVKVQPAMGMQGMQVPEGVVDVPHAKRARRLQ